MIAVVEKLIALAIDLVGHAIVKKTVDGWKVAEDAAEVEATEKFGPEPT